MTQTCDIEEYLLGKKSCWSRGNLNFIEAPFDFVGMTNNYAPELNDEG
jgi:hypothetical protein